MAGLGYVIPGRHFYHPETGRDCVVLDTSDLLFVDSGGLHGLVWFVDTQTGKPDSLPGTTAVDCPTLFGILRRSDMAWVYSWAAEFDFDNPRCLNGRFYAFDSRAVHAERFTDPERVLVHLRNGYPDSAFLVVPLN